MYTYMWTYQKYMSGCAHQCWTISAVSGFSRRSLSARLMDASESLNRCWGAVVNIADRCMQMEQLDRLGWISSWHAAFSIAMFHYWWIGPLFCFCFSLRPTIAYTLNQPTGDVFFLNVFFRTYWIWIYFPCNSFSDWVVANQKRPTKSFLNRPLRVAVSSYSQLLSFLKTSLGCSFDNMFLFELGRLKPLIESRFHGQPMIPQLGKHEDFSNGPR